MGKYNSGNSDAESSGGRAKGSLRDEIAARLHEQGAAPSGDEKKGREKPGKGPQKKRSVTKNILTANITGPLGRIKLRDVTAFCEELALLLNSGMPLVQSLKKLAERNPSFRMAGVIRNMAEVIESGGTFAGAASKHEDVFGVQFVSMFKAGERSGTLTTAIQRVADRGEIMLERRHRIVSMLTYPVIVVVAAFLVIGFGFSRAMVALGPMLEELGVSVPWTMAMLLNIGESMLTAGFWFRALAFIVALAFLYWAVMKLRPVRLVRDRFLVRCPIIGPLLKQSLVARFSRVFATMLNAGVSVPEALDGVRDVMRNELARLTVARTKAAVQEGGRIVPALEHERIFPLLAYEMMEVGEETGALGDVFARLADIYEKKAADDMEILGKLVQPAVIVTLALVVGFIVIAMFQVYTTLITHAGAM